MCRTVGEPKGTAAAHFPLMTIINQDDERTMIRSITPSSSAGGDTDQGEEQPSRPSNELHPTPIDPFKFDIKSWNQWEATFSMKTLPTSRALLDKPPTVDFFCRPFESSLLTPAKSPLTFTPQRGPIDLNSESVKPREPGLKAINLFDGKRFEKKPLAQARTRKPRSISVSTSRTAQISGGTSRGMEAPVFEDGNEFEFDWPSEEIKRACEVYLAKDQDWIWPPIDFLPSVSTKDGKEDTEMGEVQQS